MVSATKDPGGGEDGQTHPLVPKYKYKYINSNIQIQTHYTQISKYKCKNTYLQTQNEEQNTLIKMVHS